VELEFVIVEFMISSLRGVPPMKDGSFSKQRSPVPRKARRWWRWAYARPPKSLSRLFYQGRRLRRHPWRL